MKIVVLISANADGTFTGDVQNMRFINGSQKNDSLWMYPGSPIKTWRNKPYVAMVAPLILDLSGRINMGVAGNNRSAGLTHASNQGWGQWEVNPTQLGVTAADLQAIISARYGQNPTYSPNAPINRYTNLQTGSQRWESALSIRPHRCGRGRFRRRRSDDQPPAGSRPQIT